MYLPSVFCEKNAERLYALMHSYPLATMISHDEAGELWVDVLPFLLVHEAGEYVLLTHLAKNNPSHGRLHGQSVLLLFYGENGYISPNYYPSKAVHHRHVPTWNYQVVEVRGRASVFEDNKSLMALLGKLTKKHEATQQTPWAMKDAPRDYLAQEMADIVGVKVSISQMIGKYKLSQNRQPEDLAGVVAGLQQAEQGALADEVGSAYPEQHS